MDRALAGKVSDPDESILDEIEIWHAGGSGMPLHMFLGMTWDEYRRWVEVPGALKGILEARPKLGE